MSNFDGIQTAQLQANYDAIKDMDGMEALAGVMLTELDYREANAEKLANLAAMRALADSANTLLAAIAKSPVDEIAGDDSKIRRDARRTLIGLVSLAYDLSALKSEKVLMVLGDTRGQTNANGSIADAVEYVNAHKTSTVYSQTSPDDPNKGTDKPAEKSGDEKPATEKASK